MPAAFRKKPVVVNAERVMQRVVIPGSQTLHGHDLIAEPGDWIVQGVKDELYPCRDDVFRETYEPVGKEGVKALTAPGPGEEPEDREYIIPFPRRECVVSTGVPIDSLVTDTLS